MTTLLMLLLHAAAPESRPAAATVAIPLRVRKPCEVSTDPNPNPDSNEVVVCGKRHDDQFRLKPIPLPAGMKKPIDGPGMDFNMGDVHGNLYADQVGRPDGLPDRRIMIRLTKAF